MKIKIYDFFEFLKKQKVLSLSIAFIIAGQFRNIVQSFTDDFVTPLSKKITNSNKNIKIKINWSKYIIHLITLLITSYILFLLSESVDYVGEEALNLL